MKTQLRDTSQSCKTIRPMHHFTLFSRESIMKKGTILLLLIASFITINKTYSQTYTRNYFGSTVSTSSPSYTFTSSDIFYWDSMGTNISTSSTSNICGLASRRVQRTIWYFKINSSSIAAFTLFGQSNASSARNITKVESASALNGTYTDLTSSVTIVNGITAQSCAKDSITGLSLAAGTILRITLNGNANIGEFDVTSLATPTTQASGITFSGIAYNAITASWTSGNGARRAVFVKEGTSATVTTTNGITYTASADWASKGTQIGSTGYYCVYDGTGSSVALSNLTGSTTYNFIVFEYNGSGSSSSYLTTTATNNPNSQATDVTPVFYYYRSKQSGNWSDANSWESSLDNASWGNASSGPQGTASDQTITIQNGHNITVDAGTATADELTVASGGTLTVASGATLSITNGSGTDLTVASGGSLVLAGSFASAASSTITVNGTFENQVNNVAFSAGSGAMAIAAGGVYKINGYTGTSQLTFTNVTFTSGIGSLGATLYLTGAFAGRLPATNNGNVTINSTGGGTFLNTNPTTISGNLTVQATTGTGINHAAGGSARNLTVSGDVTIQAGRYDIAGSGTTSAGSSSLTVNGTLTVSGGKLYLSNTTAGGTGTLNVKGNVSYTAGVIGLPSGINTGHLVFNGSTAQAINISSTDSTLTTQNLTISNAAGITLSGTKTLDVKGYLLHTVSNATLNTGGLLKLISTASSSASIYDLTNGGTNSGNTISGNVTLQQWVTGQRGYRILSNPFNSTLDTSALASRNGITITGVNDVKTYNTANNTWTNNITTIPAKTPYAIFIRGLASEVNGLVYSAGPTAFAYNVTGTLNGTSVTLNQDNTSASAFTIAGNPFAAPVKSSALTGGVTNTPYYIYSMSQNNSGGTRVKAGGWVAASSNSSTTTRIPMMGVVAYLAGTGAGATFNVSSTSIDTTTANTIQTGLFGEGDATTQLELQLNKNGIYQDKLFVRFDANSTAKGNERMDLAKLSNDVTNIYTITSDKAHLAVDARKGIDDIIPIGVTSTVGKYSFTVASNNFVNASNVYLLDKLTNTKTALEPGATYSFEITSDASTQGDNRFELGTAKTMVQDAVASNENLSVKVLGNVVNNAVTVQVRGAKSSSVQITVVDMQGKLLSNTTSSREMNNISLVSGSGMYMIKVTDGDTSIVSKVVKP